VPRQAIAHHLKKPVTAELDGDLFDHEPDTFRFRFLDPKKLKEGLVESYSDELCAMVALMKPMDWISDHLIPVATVSTVSADNDDEDDDEPFEFAWVVVNFAAANPPGVTITTTDDWAAREPWRTLPRYIFRSHEPLRNVRVELSVCTARVDAGSLAYGQGCHRAVDAASTSRSTSQSDASAISCMKRRRRLRP
jgi:hypothetical protein